MVEFYNFIFSPSSIVLISSIAGYTPFIDIGLYSAVQTGVLGLCKALSKDLLKRKIRVNSVCLGMFDDDGSGFISIINKLMMNFETKKLLFLTLKLFF